MQIMRSCELAIQPVLQSALDAEMGAEGIVSVILSDSDEIKEPMPYVLVLFDAYEEQITPGSGIFKVTGSIAVKSHVKETSPEFRQAVLDGVNDFAYNQTAEKLSKTDEFHCYGWIPDAGRMEVDPERKAYVYSIGFQCICMPRDNH